MNKITHTFGILIIASSLLLSCGKKNEATNQAESGIQVKVVQPSTELPKTLAFKGKIASAKSTSIRTRGSSFVEEVYVKTGDQVKQGEVLIRLNNADLQAKKAQIEAQLQQVNATLADATRDLERYQNLRKKQSISAKELEQIELKLTSVEAQKQATQQQLQEVNAELNYFIIKAPFDGVITAKNVQKGDLANPQQPMLQLEGKGGFEIEVAVSERNIAHFQQGDTAAVYLDNNPSKLTAVVSEVSSSSASTGGQYKVKANLISREEMPLFSGMKARLVLATDQHSNGIFVPSSAIVRRGELKGLYVVSQQNTALLRWVRLGESFDDYVEVLSGLNKNEQVITTSESKLSNGIKVSF